MTEVRPDTFSYFCFLIVLLSRNNIKQQKKKIFPAQHFHENLFLSRQAFLLLIIISQKKTVRYTLHSFIYPCTEIKITKDL